MKITIELLEFPISVKEKLLKIPKISVKVNTKMYKKWKITMYKNRNIICT